MTCAHGNPPRLSTHPTRAIPAAACLVLALALPLAAQGTRDGELEKVGRQLPDSFRVERTGCFIVAGDLGAEAFQQIKEHTVAASAVSLHKMFFTKRPTHTIAIYLFNGEASYRKWAKKLFDEEPTTPYGYFTPSERRMVMNIRTGGGTLVHEMVHALMRVDFPNVPTWFDEGLASLFEQCRHRPDGTLEGLINWRYRGLMEAIRANRLGGLKALVRLSDSEFRGANEGMNYAQARYFCQYLQDRKLLRKFYRAFRDRYDEDPTGETFLVELLGKDLSKVDAEWLSWVKGLKQR